MAAKKAQTKKARQEAAVEPVQWKGMSAEDRRLTVKKMAASGSNRRANAEARIDALNTRLSEPQSPETVKRATKERATLTDVLPALNDRPVSLRSAAANRTRSFIESAHAAREQGQSAPAGTGWYFEHHRAIRDVADPTGFEPTRAVHASGLMSPQNSPESERTAVSALMRGFSGKSTVQMTPELHDSLSRSVVGGGIPVQVDPAHRGKSVPLTELHGTAIAALSATSRRGKFKTDADMEGITRGGMKENIAKAAEHLRGNDYSTDPIGAPKVTSYTSVGKLAVPDTAIHHEYVARVAHAADILTGHEIGPGGHVTHTHITDTGSTEIGRRYQETGHTQHRVEGQSMIDLWGLRHSHEGILNHEGHTAEDTWMNAVTHGQRHASVGERQRTSVMKTAGSNAAIATIGDTSTQHAFNNKATHMAARELERRAGLDYHLPAVAVQETVWTHERRLANKDPEFNQANVAAAKAERAAARAAKPVGKQGTLF